MFLSNGLRLPPHNAVEVHSSSAVIVPLINVISIIFFQKSDAKDIYPDRHNC